MNKAHYLMTALLYLLASGTAAFAETLPKPEINGAAFTYYADGEYHNVKSDLVDAIEARGLVISYTAHAASMLERTAAAVGALNRTYENADILMFCKADLTYQLTRANPHNLVLCPYSISIYTLTDKPQTVYLSIRRPDLQVAEYAAIHSLLEQIIADTVTW